MTRKTALRWQPALLQPETVDMCRRPGFAASALPRQTLDQMMLMELD